MASNSGVSILRYFCCPQALKNACWGAPQTRRTSGQIVLTPRRYALVAFGLSLSLLGLIFPPARHAEQMINVRFDRHSLSHIRLGLAAFRIAGFLIFRQFLTDLFLCIRKPSVRPGVPFYLLTRKRIDEFRRAYLIYHIIFLSIPRFEIRYISVESPAAYVYVPDNIPLRFYLFLNFIIRGSFLLEAKAFMPATSIAGDLFMLKRTINKHPPA